MKTLLLTLSAMTAIGLIGHFLGFDRFLMIAAFGMGMMIVALAFAPDRNYRVYDEQNERY